MPKAVKIDNFWSFKGPGTKGKADNRPFGQKLAILNRQLLAIFRRGLPGPKIAGFENRRFSALLGWGCLSAPAGADGYQNLAFWRPDGLRDRKSRLLKSRDFRRIWVGTSGGACGRRRLIKFKLLAAGWPPAPKITGFWKTGDFRPIWVGMSVGAWGRRRLISTWLKVSKFWKFWPISPLSFEIFNFWRFLRYNSKNRQKS